MSSPWLFFRHQGFWVFHTPSTISKLKLPCQYSQFQCEILFQEVEWVYVCWHWGMSLCKEYVLGRSHVICVGALEWMCVWSVLILCTPKIYSNLEESCLLRPQDFLGTKSKSFTLFKQQKKNKTIHTKILWIRKFFSNHDLWCIYIGWNIVLHLLWWPYDLL
jgi:hypothetical protein